MTRESLSPADQARIDRATVDGLTREIERRAMAIRFALTQSNRIDEDSLASLSTAFDDLDLTLSYIREESN